MWKNEVHILQDVYKHSEQRQGCREMGTFYDITQSNLSVFVSEGLVKEYFLSNMLLLIYNFVTGIISILLFPLRVMMSIVCAANYQNRSAYLTIHTTHIINAWNDIIICGRIPE